MVERGIEDVYTAAEIYIRGLEGSRMCETLSSTGGGFALEESAVFTEGGNHPVKPP